MISLAALRIVGIVIAASLGIAALYWLADSIGDLREAKVRAAYNRAIDDANTDTVASNDAATKVLLRDQRVRDQAIIAYKSSLGNVCPLTVDEAINLSRIR